MKLTIESLKQLIKEEIEKLDEDEDVLKKIQNEKLQIINLMKKAPLSAEQLARLVQLNTLENELKVKAAMQKIQLDASEKEAQMLQRYEQNQQELKAKQQKEAEEFIARQKEYDEMLLKFQKFLKSSGN